jgi:hypothetical protein
MPPIVGLWIDVEFDSWTTEPADEEARDDNDMDLR